MQKSGPEKAVARVGQVLANLTPTGVRFDAVGEFEIKLSTKDLIDHLH
jgi:hypothetical protein